MSLTLGNEKREQNERNEKKTESNWNAFSLYDVNNQRLHKKKRFCIHDAQAIFRTCASHSIVIRGGCELASFAFHKISSMATIADYDMHHTLHLLAQMHVPTGLYNFFLHSVWSLLFLVAFSCHFFVLVTLWNRFRSALSSSFFSCLLNAEKVRMSGESKDKLNFQHILNKSILKAKLRPKSFTVNWTI